LMIFLLSPKSYLVLFAICNGDYVVDSTMLLIS
jgi:hypothetical protein